MSEEFCHTKEEYLTLRKEVENMLAELSALEKNAVLAIAAVYSWVTTQKIQQSGIMEFSQIVAFGTPFFIAIFSALRTYSVNQHFGTLHDYIIKLEDRTKSVDREFIGWEHFFEADTKRRGTQSRIRTAFWACLITATLIIWIVSWCGH